MVEPMVRNRTGSVSSKLQGMFAWAVTLTAASLPVCSLELPSGLSALSEDQIRQELRRVQPQDADFKFTPPKEWGKNLVRSAEICDASFGESLLAAGRVIDGLPGSTWQSAQYFPHPELVIDLGKPQTFDRLVAFNRHTRSRGTEGGNNAASQLELWVGNQPDFSDMQPVARVDLDGPNAICFRRAGGGEVCTFVDHVQPKIAELPQTKGRFVKVCLVSAHWGENLPEGWSDSVALSELMLFCSAGQNCQR